MAYSVMRYMVIFLVLVLAQVTIFNQICLFNIAMPYAFILFLMRLPLSVNVNILYALAFLLGLCVDIFSDTLGMNSTACLLLAALRRPIISLYIPRDTEKDNLIPSINNLGVYTYMKYAITASLVYCIFISIIQSFTFDDTWLLVFRAIGSTLATFLIVWGIECLISSGSAKRL